MSGGPPGRVDTGRGTWFDNHGGVALFVLGTGMIVGGIARNGDAVITGASLFVGSALAVLGVLLPRLSGTIKITPSGVELNVVQVLEATREEAARRAPDRVEEAVGRAFPRLVDDGLVPQARPGADLGTGRRDQGCYAAGGDASTRPGRRVPVGAMGRGGIPRRLVGGHRRGREPPGRLATGDVVTTFHRSDLDDEAPDDHGAHGTTHHAPRRVHDPTHRRRNCSPVPAAGRWGRIVGRLGMGRPGVDRGSRRPALAGAPAPGGAGQPRSRGG